MISEMEAVPIWDCLGRRSVKVVVKTEKGLFSCSTPYIESGKWVRTKEVKKILENFHNVKKEFIGQNEEDFDIIDDKLEKLGFNNIGANLAIAVSKACAKAGGGYSLINPDAKVFPAPVFPVMSGWSSVNQTNIKNILIIPRASTFYDCVNIGIKFFKDIGNVLSERGVILGRGFDGSWLSHYNDIKSIELVSHYAEQQNIGVGVDFGADDLYRNGYYVYTRIGKKFNTGEQLEFIKQMVRQYNINYVQNPFHSNDFSGLSELSRKIKSLICGLDLFASQPGRIKKGISERCGNVFGLELERAGTVSRALRMLESINESGNIGLVSDCTTETNDGFLADLGVGGKAKLVRTGLTGCRTAKLNRLLEIWFDISSRTAPEMADVRV